MRVFAGGITTETNTFSPVPTGLDDYILAYKGSEDDPCECQILRTLRQLTEAHSWTFCPAFIAFAEPGGITTRTAYEHLRECLLDDLTKKLPVDMVLLPLHGAMVAEGYDDCEGDIIARVREIVGPDIPIGVELDLHCHLTQTIMDNSDLIAIFKEYPHIDILSRAEDLFYMTADMAMGKTKPVMAMHDCKVINLYPTPLQPMRSIVDNLFELEKHPGIISADIAHGFPWGDVADCGARTLVITDGDRELAKSTAKDIAQTLFDLRHELQIKPLSLNGALDQAFANPHSGKPFVIADQSDNAGGGAASDSTFALDALLERGVTNCAVAMIWDPQVVQTAEKAGEGACIRVRLGGKTAVTSGDPLDLDVTVKRIIKNFIQPFPQGENESIPVPCGDTVCLECQGIYIIVNSTRTQVFHPKVFTAFGLNLADMEVLVVKSIFHFHAGFAPIAEQILLMGAPGPLNTRFTEVPYQKADLNKFPWINYPDF